MFLAINGAVNAIATSARGGWPGRAHLKIQTPEGAPFKPGFGLSGRVPQSRIKIRKSEMVVIAPEDRRLTTEDRGWGRGRVATTGR
jgi:hypothetical protein